VRAKNARCIQTLQEVTRYFFDIYNGHLHRDHLGEDLPDDARAWREALRIVRDVEDMLAPGGT
jgi:hypothetical protein